jgi:serine/threonine protein phosphatase 1
MRRKIFIGDVHGCFRELMDLLKECDYNHKKDKLYFVGDLINKGPYSKKVLEFVYNSKAKVVIGNHELGLIKLYDSKKNWGGSTLDLVLLSLGKEAKFWIKWMKKLPSFIEEDDFILVHAGLIPDKKPRERDREILARIRTWDGRGKDLNNEKHPPWYNLYKGKKKVIFGHWAKKGIIFEKNLIGLDSGCCYGRKLSAYILEEDEIVQVSARRQYEPYR